MGVVAKFGGGNPDAAPKSLPVQPGGGGGSIAIDGAGQVSVSARATVPLEVDDDDEIEVEPRFALTRRPEHRYAYAKSRRISSNRFSTSRRTDTQLGESDRMGLRLLELRGVVRRAGHDT